MFLYFVFFFKQKTSYEMRISDWSSDVCSSDLRHLDLRIDMEDRIAMLGANGNGKSTLAKILAGTLKPQAGKIQRSGKLRIGYFAQDQDEVQIGSASCRERVCQYV